MEHHYLLSSFQQNRNLIQQQSMEIQKTHPTDLSLKIDAIPSSYICVKNFLTPMQTLTLPSKLPPTPFLTTPDSNYRNAISDDVAQLKTANTANVWTAWARYHSQRSHHTRKPDISAILLLTDAPVHTLDTQYHCMEIAEKTTQLLNPGQICVDESNQPVYKLSDMALTNIFACLDLFIQKNQSFFFVVY